MQNKNFNNKITLLLQQNNKCLDTNLLKYYIDNLKINNFCVGSIEQAQQIKDINPLAEITGSITMKIMPDILNENISLYQQYFNNFVLWFPYNRDLQLIKQLPEEFKYILLINCACHKECQGTAHWLASSAEAESQIFCKASKDNNINNKIYIPPQHLPLFNQYVSYYKLQGREYHTNEIIKDVVKYTVPLKEFNLYETSLSLTSYNL